MQITKNATDNSKNNYKGYGICFDERIQFSHTILKMVVPILQTVETH